MLPQSVRPCHYSLSIEPNDELSSFKAIVSIKLDVKERVKVVQLNASGLELDSVSVNEQAAVSFAVQEEVLTVQLADELAPDTTALLRIAYSGKITEDSVGIYRNSYAGGRKRGVATQLFATFARRMFPCWDEPNFKATFDLTIVVQEDLTVRFNSPCATAERLNGKKKISFHSTPKMSTYLLALFVGEAEPVTHFTRKAHKAISVWVPMGAKRMGDFAASVAIKAVDFYEEYFGIDLPVEKVDMIGLDTFLYGGMENWGLIYYPSHLLYVDADVATHAQLQRCASVVCHEIAHNWFGNLVTINWWNDIWLSEGFATYMGWLAMGEQFPHWDVPCLLFSEEMSSALRADAFVSTHAVELDASIKDPNEVLALIDSITYCKGLACLMIAADSVGAEKFRQGVHDYLLRFSYGNATTRDLWEALHLEDSMSVWTKTKGYPVVHASWKDGKLVLSQERFLASGAHSDEKTVWKLSLTTISGSGEVTRIPFHTKEAVIDNVPALDSFLLLNHGGKGLYRTVYDEHLWNRIVDHAGSIQAVDLLHLLDGVTALSRANKCSAVFLLKLLRSLRATKRFTNPHVALAVLDELNVLNGVFEGIDGLKKLRRDTYTEIFHEVGEQAKPEEAPLTSSVRSRCLEELWEDNATLYVENFKHWEDFTKDTNRLKLIFRTAVAKEVASFDQVIEISKTPICEEDATVKRIVLNSLGRSKDKEKFVSLLKETSSGNFNALFCSSSDYPMLRTFLESNWDHAWKQCGGTAGTMASCFVHAFSRSTVEAIDAFFTSLPGDHQNLIRARVEQLKEQRANNAAWVDRDKASVEAFFK